MCCFYILYHTPHRPQVCRDLSLSLLKTNRSPLSSAAFSLLLEEQPSHWYQKTKTHKHPLWYMYLYRGGSYSLQCECEDVWAGVGGYVRGLHVYWLFK